MPLIDYETWVIQERRKAPVTKNSEIDQWLRELGNLKSDIDVLKKLRSQPKPEAEKEKVVPVEKNPKAPEKPEKVSKKEPDDDTKQKVKDSVKPARKLDPAPDNSKRNPLPRKE